MADFYDIMTSAAGTASIFSLKLQSVIFKIWLNKESGISEVFSLLISLVLDKKAYN